MKYQTLPARPTGPTPSTDSRWNCTGLRYRLLSGRWSGDLEQELRRHLPADRRAIVGEKDMSSNVLRSCCQALAALYDTAPSVAHDENIDQLIGRDALLDRAGLWPLMAQLQYYLLGTNECLLRIDIANNEPGLKYRIVIPNSVYATQPTTATEPDYLYELRVRTARDGSPIWTADVFDLRDKNDPKYQVRAVQMNGDLGDDLTEHYFGSETSGDLYPYRDKNNAPYMPYSIYHRKITGQLWNPYENEEVARGSLVSATMLTMWGHIVKNASWPQRYVAGLTLPVGAYDIDNSARRAAISTDPSSILCFVADPSSEGIGQTMIGQFQAGGDPEKILNSIVVYNRALCQMMGIQSGDVTRLAGDPRSGYSLSISRESTRENQRKQSICMRYGDKQTLAISAKLANRFLGTNLPETGYRMEYNSVPLSPEELKAQREDIISKLQAGLMDPITAILRLYPDWDEETAINYLTSIEEGRKRFPFMVQQQKQGSF